MGKTYIDTVKYLIFAEIEVDGLVDKPDVVGAIFGQTEGLLGDDLDLRELQKNGRIGRIDVDLNTRSGKTYGIVKVPSSLDMVETSIIAASLEVVDRIGPCDGRVKVQKIEDTRNQKRKLLVERAKNLLKNLLNTEIPESKEISEQVREEVKSSEVSEYGPEKLACGPGIEKMDEIILVEGRADVINLLKNDITNVIAIGGARVTRTIVELSKGKEVTVFLDGDRGGDIILNELIHGGVEIDFVARAPTGKEVEELTRKEIIKTLRNKIPFEQIEGRKSKPFAQPYQTKRHVVEQPQIVQTEVEGIDAMEGVHTKLPSQVEKKKSNQASATVQPILERIQHIIMPQESEDKVKSDSEVDEKRQERVNVSNKSIEEFKNELNELTSTLKARIYSDSGVLMREIPVRDIIQSIKELDSVGTIIFDGIITQRLVDIASEKNVKTIIGVKLGNVTKKPEGLTIITKIK